SGAIAAGSNNVTLTSTSNINESTGSISGVLLTTSSFGGTTLGGANTVSSFNATNTGGNISLTNTGALSITGVSQAGGGNLAVTNTGSITVNGVAAVAGGGTVNLTANGATSDITLNANVTSGSGAITLVSGRNTLLSNGNISTTGNVSITATGTISEANS